MHQAAGAAGLRFVQTRRHGKECLTGTARRLKGPSLSKILSLVGVLLVPLWNRVFALYH
jgi:hypothetical protein